MKAKVVQYPFNHKRFEWDTFTLNKKFEYSWSRQLVANYSTMAPYIKTEQQDPASNDYAYIDLAHDSANQPDWEAYNNAFTYSAVAGSDYYDSLAKTLCGAGDDIDQRVSDDKYYDAIGGYHFATLQPGTPGDYVSISNINKEYRTFTYWSINAENCNDFGLTEIQFNKMAEEGFDLTQFLNYYNKYHFENRHYHFPLPSEYDKGDGTSQYATQPVPGNIAIGKKENNQDKFINEKDYVFSYDIVTNDVGAKTIEIKYTYINNLKGDLTFTYNSLNVEGEPYWEQKTFTAPQRYLIEKWKFVDRDRLGPTAIIARGFGYGALTTDSCLMYQMYRYNFTGFVCKRSDNGPHKVYGVKGKTYNEPALVAPVTGAERYHIFGVNNYADCSLIGEFTDTTGVEFDKIIFEDPNEYINDYVETLHYSSTWGLSRDSHTENCIAVAHDEQYGWLINNVGFSSSGYDWLFIPLENQQLDASENDSFAITIGDSWPTSTAWGALAIFYGFNTHCCLLETTQPSNYISTFPYLIRKSDWPDYTGYYTPQAWEMNGAMVVRPEIRLLGDQTAANINVNISSNPAYSYVIGDYANGTFTPKPLQQYVPATYKPVWNESYEVWNYKVKVVNDTSRHSTYETFWFYPNDKLKVLSVSEHPEVAAILDQVTPALATMPRYNGSNQIVYVFEYNTVYDFHSEANVQQIVTWLANAWDPSFDWEECLDSGYIEENGQYSIYTPIEKVMDVVPVIVDYEPDGYSWLTYNSYTKNEWENGYHLIGDNWNGLNSPYGYVNGVHEANGNREVYLYYEDCPNGSYANLLTLLGAYDGTITDTVGNTLPTSMTVFNAALGPVVNTATIIVTSNKRNEHPDNGIVGGYLYTLKPELTKFIEYNDELLVLYNVELREDRYTHSHNDEYLNLDTSLYNTVIGTPSSTNENSIPDAYVRTYKGIYYGQSIPFLGITETVIDPGQILGVPVYDKQINTSDTLKYGTVASASVSFLLDIPVDQAMAYNNKMLVLFYDFKHNGAWEPWGFFRIDTIEAEDENSTSIVGHDEVYKLNKYVDDFLKNYSGATTLNRFYKDLLDYCDCEYDPNMPSINNGSLALNNIYNATKTTGLEVAHYIANISPGFIHANMDNDIVLSQYKPTSKVKTISDYSNLVYNAYNTDMLNKVIITMNNAVIGEDTGSGTNTYYIADNPILSKHISDAALNLLATKILQKYQQIPAYRPAQVKFLTSPGIDIGDIFTIVTKNSQQYNVAAMQISVNESGLEIKSMGTAAYPVDPSSSSQFVNLVDSIDTVQIDVDSLDDAVAGLDGRVGDAETDIDDLQTRMTTAEGNIQTNATNLTNKINSDSISQSNNLISVKINGTTKSNITNKTYVDNADAALDSRLDDCEDGLVTVGNSLATKILADSISSANDLVTVKINGDTVSNIATKAYVDNTGGLGFTPAAFIAAKISITGNTSIDAWYIGRYNADVNLWNGLLLPLEKYAGYNLFQATTNGILWGLSASDGDWHIITNGSYSRRV